MDDRKDYPELGKPIARLLDWRAPKNFPVPHGGIAARTFAEFPEDMSVETRYWFEGGSLYTAEQVYAAIDADRAARGTPVGWRVNLREGTDLPPHWFCYSDEQAAAEAVKHFTVTPLYTHPPAAGVPEGWISVDDKLPDFGVPVWLYEAGRIYVGERSDEADGWLWTNCYNSHYYNGTEGRWMTHSAELDDDYKPTFWRHLPKPPGSTETAEEGKARMPLDAVKRDEIYREVQRQVSQLEADDRYSFAGWFPIAVKLIEQAHGIRLDGGREG